MEGGEKKFKSQRSLLKKKRRRRSDASARVLLCGCVNTMAFFLTTETGQCQPRDQPASAVGAGGISGYVRVQKQPEDSWGKQRVCHFVRWQTQVQPLQPLLILGCKADEPAADLRGTASEFGFGFCF